MLKKIKFLQDYFKYLSNPIEVLRFKFNLKNECTIKIKNTPHNISLKNVNSLNLLMNSLPNVKKENIVDFLEYIKSIDDDEEYLNISGIKFINTYNSEFIKTHDNEYYCHLTEFFTDDVLNILNYQERHVIDIGGNIGDTALLFAKSGADVISLEPVKHLYDLAVENVNLNPQLKDKIILVNKAIGGKKGKLKLDSTSVAEYTGSNDTEMEVITMKDFFEEYDFTPDILKMDCEGCEFEIIAKNDLTMFNEILFEHHGKIVNKDFNILVKELKKQGFNIEFYQSEGVDSIFEEQGMIYAFK